MSPEEQKIERLKKLMEVANQDFATTEDVTRVFEVIIESVKELKQSLKDTVASNSDSLSGNVQKQLGTALNKLSSVEDSLIGRLSDKASLSELTKLSNKLTKDVQSEVNRVTKLIPKLPDISDVRTKLAEIENALAQIPRIITQEPEAIRDSLELLQGDSRLDKSAIRGLDEALEVVTAAANRPTVNGGKGKVVEVQAGSNITVDNTDPNRPIVASTGGGGGHVIEDEGTPLTQRANLNFVGAGVTTTDAGGKTVVTVPGGSGSGTTRTVVVTSGNVTAGATAVTDYVYLIAGAHTVTMPTAVGNTNLYELKNNHSANISLATTAAQTIDGVTAPVMIPEQALTLVSDGTNWRIV